MTDRRALLTRFAGGFWIELRLLVWNWFYLLLHVLWSAYLIWGWFIVTDDRSARALLETNLGHFYLSIISLVGIFMASISASRSSRNKFRDLENTYPTGCEVMLGRWLAGLTALLGFSLVAMVIAGIQGPFLALLSALPVFIGESVLSLSLVTALIWWLVGGLKMGRWSYPLLALGWYTIVLVPLMLSAQTPEINLFNFMRQGFSYYSEVWGRLVYGNLLDWSNLFYVSLLLVILGLWDAMSQIGRMRRFPTRSLVLILAAIGLTGFSADRYVLIIKDTERQMEEEAAITASQPAIPEAMRVAVTRYDLSLDMQDPANPHFSAAVNVVNRGSEPLDELVFSLDYRLALLSANLPYKRDGNTLYFSLLKSLPVGQEVALQVDYTGSLWHTEFSDGFPVALDFVTGRGVRLTPAVIWYPQPLNQPAAVWETDLAIDLKIIGAEQLIFASNLPAINKNEFGSGAASWIFLIGSPTLIQEQVGKVTLITTRNDLARVRELAAQYEEPLDTMQRFFPDVPVDGLMMMCLGEESGLPAITLPSAGRPLVVISRSRLVGLDSSNYDHYQLIFYPLVSDLWNLGSDKLNDNPDTIIHSLANYLWVYDQFHGQSDKMQESIAKNGDQLTQEMLAIQQEQGENGVVQAVKELRLHSSELRGMSADDIASWLKQDTHVQ